MARHWALGMIALVMGAGNLGCYYDQWQNAERDNRILREDLSRTKQDLADCESMNAQKDTMIDALNGLADFLKQAADTIEQTDADIAAKLNG